MSILDALRVQKANQRSIADLAVLPQNEIIRLAQMGHIPADVVPVVISEKARMAKDMANLQAASQVQGGMPTVIEQAMQQNAAAEAPPATPAGGVADLPTGQMFQEQNFQSGGIVAFNGAEQSYVKDSTGLNVLASEMENEMADPALTRYVNQFKAMTAAARQQSPEEAAHLEAIKKGSLSPEDKRQQQWMRVLQGSLGVMAGKSPYGLQNLSEGLQPALAGYAEDIKNQRTQQREELKAASDIARAKRQEELGDIAGGADLYKAAMERQQRLAIAKDSQLGAKYADNYVLMRKQAGDIRPDEVLRDEGYRQFFKEYGYASGRAATQASIAANQQATTAATAAGAQSVAAAAVAERFATQAQESVDKVLGKLASPESREYRRLQKESPEKAAEYRQRLVEARARELAGASQSPGASPRPSPGASAPAAAASAAARPASAASAARPAAPVPMPQSQAELKNGVIYQTPRGPLRWDASSKQFFPVQ